MSHELFRSAFAKINRRLALGCTQERGCVLANPATPFEPNTVHIWLTPGKDAVWAKTDVSFVKAISVRQARSETDRRGAAQTTGGPIALLTPMLPRS